ncbi:MAG TPA: hypothetical protein VG370_31535 [Chloroflexota bacterium]|nr:hypothetical protein [Chloroflexota bacterium]
MSELRHRQVPPEAEAALEALLAVEPLEERARLLANTISRAVAALHRLARDEAAAHKGRPDWAAWAKLVNASRQAVLQAASCRDIAAGLAAAPKEGP